MRGVDDLIAFVTARLDEDEAAAKTLASDMPHLDAMCACIAAGGSARVLREVAAKRAILDRHSPHETAFNGLACNWCSEDVDDRPQLAKERWPCPDVLSLAAVWSDRPGYRDDWKP